MRRKEALEALLAKVEAGEWPADKAHDFLGRDMLHATSAYNGSLGAAKALHDAVLPRWRPRLELGGFDGYNTARDPDAWTVSLWHTDPTSIHSLEGPSGQGEDPARSWLCAILKALIAECNE